MNGDRGGDHRELAPPSDGDGGAPEIFPLPRQSTYGWFAEANGVLVGWRNDQFLIMSQLGTKRLHSFPLTEEGWMVAWLTMSSQYPQLAENVSGRLAAEGRERAVGQLATYAVLQDRTLLRGYGWPDAAFVPGTSCTLRFNEEGLFVDPYLSGRAAFIRSPFKDALAPEFSGPGRVTTGGKVFGGGFGPVGAAEGMIAASVINALTTRTKIHTVIRYEATNLEAFFFYSKETPDNLRMQMSKVLSHIRPKGQPGAAAAAPSTRLDQLKQLGELRDSGVLNEAEFEAEKQRISASDS
jgi:hypothetical protein